MRPHVIVTLSAQWLQGSTVAPATRVFAYVREPRIRVSDWDANFRRSEWEETKKAFEVWGCAMVVVSPFGMIVGEYVVEPYLITPEQFSVLEKARAA